MEFKEPLSDEKQRKLLEERDNHQVRNKLIEHNLRLVNWVAIKYYKPGKNDLDDLFQQGVLGLIKAIENYDPDKGSFSNYAVIWIKQAITRGIENKEKTIRIPSYLNQKLIKLSDKRIYLTQHFGREPTLEELSKELDISQEEILRLDLISNDPISLNNVIGAEEDLTIEDTIPDTSPTPDEVIEDKIFNRQLIAELKAALTIDQYKTMLLRHGFYNEPRTLEVIGKHLGVTREKVRQIEYKALRKLRKVKFFMDLRDDLYHEVEENTIYYRSPNYGRGGGTLSTEQIAIEREKNFEKIEKKHQERLARILKDLDDMENNMQKRWEERK